MSNELTLSSRLLVYLIEVNVSFYCVKHSFPL
jgi:hypothetical protein